MGCTGSYPLTGKPRQRLHVRGSWPKLLFPMYQNLNHNIGTRVYSQFPMYHNLDHNIGTHVYSQFRTAPTCSLWGSDLCQANFLFLPDEITSVKASGSRLKLLDPEVRLPLPLCTCFIISHSYVRRGQGCVLWVAA